MAKLRIAAVLSEEQERDLRAVVSKWPEHWTVNVLQSATTGVIDVTVDKGATAENNESN